MSRGKISRVKIPFGQPKNNQDLSQNDLLLTGGNGSLISLTLKRIRAATKIRQGLANYGRSTMDYFHIFGFTKKNDGKSSGDSGEFIFWRKSDYPKK